MDNEQSRAPVRIGSMATTRALLPDLSALEGTPIERWAVAVAVVAGHPSDVPTLSAWADLLAISRATLCNRCRAVRAPARDSLVLARLARTLRLGNPDCWEPEHFLATYDRRTLVSLLRRVGLFDYHGRQRPSLAELLSAQRFRIPPVPLAELGRVLTTRAGRA